MGHENRPTIRRKGSFVDLIARIRQPGNAPTFGIGSKADNNVKPTKSDAIPNSANEINERNTGERTGQQPKRQYQLQAVTQTTETGSWTISSKPQIQPAGLRPPKSYVQRQLQDKQRSPSNEGRGSSSSRIPNGHHALDVSRKVVGKDSQSRSELSFSPVSSNHRGLAKVSSSSAQAPRATGTRNSIVPSPERDISYSNFYVSELEQLVKTQKLQNAEILQQMSEELDAVIASRDTLVTQLEVMRTTYSTQEQRINRLEKRLHRALRQKTHFEIKMQDLQVRFEEKLLENDELRRSLSRVHRISPFSAASSLESAGLSIPPDPKTIAEAD